MPKQIILEYPWKAMLEGNTYFISDYNDFEYPKYAVYPNIVMKINEDGIEIHCLYENDSKIGQFFTQCQTELNNQL